MTTPNPKKEPTMSVETVRPEALELIADQAAGRITEEQLLEHADTAELSYDDLEAAQQEFDAQANAEDAQEEQAQVEVAQPESEPETLEQLLARLTQEREQAKGSAKGALTRQIKVVEAEIAASRTPTKARKITVPEKELEPMLASSKAHAESKPKQRRVYFANVDTEPDATRSWGVIVEGELVGTLSAVKVDGIKHYRVKGPQSQTVDLGVDKVKARRDVAESFGGVAYWGS